MIGGQVDVSRLYPACDQQPEGVHQNVALAAFDTLVRVEAANAATFRRLHRLAIHDDDRRTGGPGSKRHWQPVRSR